MSEDRHQKSHENHENDLCHSDKESGTGLPLCAHIDPRKPTRKFKVSIPTLSLSAGVLPEPIQFVRDVEVRASLTKLPLEGIGAKEPSVPFPSRTNQYGARLYPTKYAQCWIHDTTIALRDDTPSVARTPGAPPRLDPAGLLHRMHWTTQVENDMTTARHALGDYRKFGVSGP